MYIQEVLLIAVDQLQGVTMVLYTDYAAMFKSKSIG